MTTQSSSGGPALAARPGRSGWVVPFAILTMLGAGALVWWWFRPLPLDPPLPPGIQDAEVREAIEHARQEVLNQPRSASAWGLLGRTLHVHLFDREADRCYAEAARLAPANARWPYGRAVLALKRDPEQALTLLRQAVAVQDSWPEGRFAMRMQLGEALLERRQLDEAAPLFRDELLTEPDSPRANFGLGLVLIARGNGRSAEACLNAARASPLARKRATAQLAALAGAREDGGTAAAALAKEAAALPDDPPWPDPFREENLKYQVGHRRWERAAAQLAQLESAHQYEEALGVYLEWIKKQPTTSQPYVGAGLNLARMHRYDEALPLLRKSVELDRDSANAHYTLGLVLFGQAETALQQGTRSTQIKDWLELKPDYARAYLHWGMALRFLGKADQAVEPLRKGVDCRPEEFDLQLQLGEVLLLLGQYQEAETYLEQARRLDPNNPRIAQDLEQLRNKKN
jgi:tetratricopeptide (TPR) repeat protein